MTSNFEDLQKRYVVDTYVNRQLNLVKGKGVFVFNDKGKAYLDLMSNYGVNLFGHVHPVITKALIAQIKLLISLHGSFVNNTRTKASEMLIKRCGGLYSQVFWSNSGAEAVETALKFAVLATGKKRFVVCNNAFHGKTLGALSATSGEKYKKPFEPLLWEFVKIPFNDLRALEKAIDKNTAGFIVEPVQGEGGIHVPSLNYLKEVKKICSKNNNLLIIDEIQTGIGRTGKFLASEEISGDILCLGKGLAGGIPVGATIITKNISLSISKHIHSSTFGGNPLSMAGVLATLKLLDKNQLIHINEIGKYFLTELSKLQSPLVLGVRGKGLMIGLVLKDKRSQVLKLLQDNNVLAIPGGENVVRFLPPYILEKSEVDIAIKALRKIFKELS